MDKMVLDISHKYDYMNTKTEEKINLLNRTISAIRCFSSLFFTLKINQQYSYLIKYEIYFNQKQEDIFRYNSDYKFYLDKK